VSLTLAEALKLSCFAEAKVVAGHLGLHREVRYVNIMEVPDIVNWVNPEELLLTTGYTFRDSPESLIELVTQLHQKGLAAIAIKPQRFLGQLPSEALSAADRLAFPVIELPLSTKFGTIIKAVLTEVVNRDYQKIIKSEQIHKTFSKLVLSGGGVSAVAASLATLCHAFVNIADRLGNTLAHSEGAAEVPDMSDFGGIWDVRAVDVKLYDAVAAQVHMWKGGQISKEEVVALERAAELVAFVLLQNNAVQEVQKAYRNDFLNDLIAGEIQSREMVLQRGLFFGLNLSLSYALLLVDVDSFADMFLQTLDEVGAHARLEKLHKIVMRVCHELSPDCIAWDRSDSVIILFPIEVRWLEYSAEQRLSLIFEMAMRVKSAIDKSIHEFTVSVGIGSFRQDIMHIHSSYDEARTALKIGKLAWGKNGVYSYDKLGIYSLLTQLQDKQSVAKFIGEQLGPLVDYDLKRGTNYVETLSKLLDNNCHRQRTAERLFVHPKTLAYRVQRIQEILNVSLCDTEATLSLHVALKIMSMPGVRDTVSLSRRVDLAPQFAVPPNDRKRP